LQPEGLKISRKPAKRHRSAGIQYGALPYRVHADASMEILLVTSRGTKRWIIPKGWPIKGLKPGEAAAREAYEEAGVRGRVGRSLGKYVYDKYSQSRENSFPCAVRVFPLAVRRQLKGWPEAHERQAQWYSVAEAASMVGEGGLRELILSLASRKSQGAGKGR
jgi:8-oxo-dGTP pyrophosphatase MutT (NUDIX family)